MRKRQRHAHVDKSTCERVREGQEYVHTGRGKLGCSPIVGEGGTLSRGTKKAAGTLGV